MNIRTGRVFMPVFDDVDNSLQAFIPEVWAQESLMILEANLIVANMVYRDFSNQIAMYGDVVNTRLPAKFNSVRKTDGQAVTIQAANATNVPVPLDQHFHTTFMIHDGEESKGFPVLRDTYLVPAVQSVARGIDEALIGQIYQFLPNTVGQLGSGLVTANVVAAREQLNNTLCPIDGRSFLVTPNTEGDLLNIPGFTQAYLIGDDGTALREGSVGRKFGFNFEMSQLMPSIASGNTVVTGMAVNQSAGYAKGTTAIAVDGHSGALTAGSWCTIAGDMTPQKITGSTGGGSPTAIAIYPGLRNAVVNNAAITIYTPGQVDLSAGYDADWSEELVTKTFTVAPKRGQLVSMNATGDYSEIYGAINTPTTTSLLLNRPLDVGVSNNGYIGIGPAGEYNFAFHRNALALVTRPLAPPAAGTGALSYVASYNNLALRVTITYDGHYQGHLVTVDVLAGVKVLNTDMGCIVLA